MQQAHIPQYIYHLADAANWASIQRSGLLSTSMLLDIVGVQGEARDCIEQHQRNEQVTLANGVVIRDQRPMPPAALERCLHGMTPGEWYALLNSYVFFWPDIERLNRMLKANGKRPQVIMVLETEQLLAKYAERAVLTPINTGNARRQPALRGRQTFVPYEVWVETRWASEAEALGTRTRPSSHQPAELAIAGAVPDIMNFVKQTRALEQGELLLEPRYV